MANWQHRITAKDIFLSYEPQETAEAEKAEAQRMGKAVVERLRGCSCLAGFRLKCFTEAETEAQANRASGQSTALKSTDLSVH